MFIIRKSISVCIFLIPSLVQAVVLRHDLDSASYGELASREPFAPIVEIEVATAFGTRTGSGVIVADGWVLTAAHVTWGASDSSVSVRIGGSGVAAGEILYPEAWSSSPVVGLRQGNDLALIRVGSTSGVLPATIATQVDPGDIGFLGGFGRSGNGVLGASSSRTLGFAMNVIDRQLATVGGGLLVTDFDDGTSARNSLDSQTARRTYYDAGFDSPLLSTTVLDAGSGQSQPGFSGLPTAADFFPGLPDEFLEGTTAGGDSGGPMFVYNVAVGEWELAGLASWGINPLLPEGFARTDSRYGDIALFTDLSANRDWVLARVPEPSLAVILALGAGLAATRRGRESC
jgi:hypothetical protein